jgi:hypothetical protein
LEISYIRGVGNSMKAPFFSLLFDSPSHWIPKMDKLHVLNSTNHSCLEPIFITQPQKHTHGKSTFTLSIPGTVLPQTYYMPDLASVSAQRQVPQPCCASNSP